MLTARFVLFLLPVFVYLVCLLVPFLRGKRPSRFAVTTGLSLVLLIYFLVVTGTGIFWVAVQELPVFDWHYLPGYILLIIGLTHTVLHWKNLALLFRKNAPAWTVEPSRARFRHGVRFLGYALLGGMVMTIVFFLGVRKGTQHIVFESAASNSSVSPLKRSLVKTPLIPPIMVTSGGSTMSLAEMYHKGSSYPSRASLPGLTLAARPPIYKDYPEKKRMALPPIATEDGLAIVDLYRAWISGTSFGTPPPLTLSRLASILHHTQGITKTLNLGSRTFDLRSAPSAGALYPLNLYIAVFRVEGLAPGLYYYHPKESALILVRSDLTPIATGSQDLVESAPAMAIFTATFGRTAFKYAERAYRYAGMDVGHAAYNLGLTAASQGYWAPMIARFDDLSLNALMNLDPSVEATLLVMPIGATKTASAESLFEKEHTEKESAKNSFVDLIHGGTNLRYSGGSGALPRFPRIDATGRTSISLPAPAMGKHLLAAIRERRSVREFAGGSLTQQELSALCAASAEENPLAPVLNPLLAASAPVHLYIAVKDIKGLQPGIYRYDSVGHAIQLVKKGDFSATFQDACLKQEFCGTANVLFIKTVKWRELHYPDGDRGYRYACLRAGVLGSGLYLQSTALGLGACGVGAFEDPSVATVVGLNTDEEIPLYLTAVGRTIASK